MEKSRKIELKNMISEANDKANDKMESLDPESKKYEKEWNIYMDNLCDKLEKFFNDEKNN